MSRFLYFFPGASSAHECESLLRDAGLGDVIQKASRTWATVFDAGPNGGAGIVMVNRVDPSIPCPVYSPDAQTWCECGDAETGLFWIGYTTDDPPGPADLARPKPLPGWKVRLGDGRDWTVPIAVACPHAGTIFPTEMQLKPGRVVEHEVAERYRELDAYAHRVFDSVTEELVFNEDDSVTIGWAGKALSTNYYAGEWELGAALRCFDTGSLHTVLEALINWPAFGIYREILDGKKNLPPDFFTQFAGFEASFPDMSLLTQSFSSIAS